MNKDDYMKGSKDTINFMIELNPDTPKEFEKFMMVHTQLMYEAYQKIGVTLK